MAAAQKKCEVVDSWEDIDETELMPSSFQNRTNRAPQGNSRGSSVNGVLIVQEDSLRSQYTPPEPSVKILKRPSKGEGGDGCVSDALVNGEGGRGGKARGRTLQQRQMDYAEARLRIMGQASPDEEAYDRLSHAVGATGSSPGVGVPAPSSGQGPVTLLRPCDPSNVVRLPRGPDGTRGFGVKR